MKWLASSRKMQERRQKEERGTEEERERRKEREIKRSLEIPYRRVSSDIFSLPWWWGVGTQGLGILLSRWLLIQCCFTSTETMRLISDREPKLATSTSTQLLSCDPQVASYLPAICQGSGHFCQQNSGSHGQADL